jgi:hypothetical protein
VIRFSPSQTIPFFLFQILNLFVAPPLFLESDAQVVRPDPIPPDAGKVPFHHRFPAGDSMAKSSFRKRKSNPSYIQSEENQKCFQKLGKIAAKPGTKTGNNLRRNIKILINLYNNIRKIKQIVDRGKMKTPIMASKMKEIFPCGNKSGKT